MSNNVLDEGLRQNYIDLAKRYNELKDFVFSLQKNQFELKRVLEWYGEQARLCRLIHKEGDSGRAALADDGGKRAQNVLSNTIHINPSADLRAAVASVAEAMDQWANVLRDGREPHLSITGLREMAAVIRRASMGDRP